MNDIARNIASLPRSSPVAWHVALAQHMSAPATRHVTPLPSWERAFVWLGLAVVVIGIYLIVCIIRPYARCFWCRNDREGRRSSKTKKTWGNCRHCKGTGKRLRVGRWFMNWWHDNKKRAGT